MNVKDLSKRQLHRLCKKRALEIENELVVSINKEHIPSSLNKYPKTTDQSFSDIVFDSNTFTKRDISNSDCESTDSFSNSSVFSEEKNVDEGKNNILFTPKINEQLVSWATKYNVPNVATTDLLHILNPHIPGLPLDARTLLDTPRTCEIEMLGDGQFKYFGIRSNLISTFSKGLVLNYHPIMRPIAEDFFNQGLTLITLSINVDGLPITSSSTKAFWPILGIVDQVVHKQPFVIGLYCGEKKPGNANEFLQPFVDECLELEVNGIVVNGIHYAFRISCIIADAPARQFLKLIVSHCSSHACEKCTQEGSTYNRRMTWQFEKTKLQRTDEGFRNTEYLHEHQRGQTILSTLSIGLVSNVPLDYLHLLCLGVMKKLVRVWVEKGPKKCKLRASSIETISERLSIIAKHHMPLEFARRPRSLNIFKFWKATEYRSFLLYLGAVVLFKVLPKDLYDHFLVFHVSIYILTSSKANDPYWRGYAQNLIESFVKFIPELYSNELLIYNFHNLTHLTKDVENYGALDNFSAFPFENYMRVIKKMVRSPNHAIEQVVKRLGEKDRKSASPKQVKLTKGKNNNIKFVPFAANSSCAVGIGLKDGCFLTKDNKVVVIRKIKMFNHKGEFLLTCNKFKFKEDFYEVPLNSSKLGIFSVHSLEKINERLLSDELQCKCLLLPNFSQEEHFICIPYCNMDSFY